MFVHGSEDMNYRIQQWFQYRYTIQGPWFAPVDLFVVVSLWGQGLARWWRRRFVQKSCNRSLKPVFKDLSQIFLYICVAFEIWNFAIQLNHQTSWYDQGCPIVWHKQRVPTMMCLCKNFLCQFWLHILASSPDHDVLAPSRQNYSESCSILLLKTPCIRAPLVCISVDFNQQIWDLWWSVLIRSCIILLSRISG